MSEKETEKSFGEMPTLGHEERVKPERPAPEGLSWTALGLSDAETLKAREGVGGIVDDGRTDGAQRWKAGEEILGRYVVERELGQGGMGVVYGCLDKVGGVRVAVKCLPPELSHNSVEMEEVRENFELVYKLNHPNIVAVKTLERDGRGEYFLVMDVAEGESLRKWLRRKWKEGGVGLAEAVGILRQVASALDYAHGKKVIHRDIKPGNVMVDGRTGEVKVLDFGLAAQIRTSLSRASHAYRGTSGTGPYMAPEQWEGKQQDGAADQYALGVMAYEMLAGHLPFENSELAVLKDAVLHGHADSVPGLPKVAMDALRRALAKKKEERFGSCTEFVEALAGERRRAGDGPPRRSVGGWVAALVLAAGVAGAWWWGGGRENAGGTPAQRQEEAARPEGSPHQQTAEEAEAAKRAEVEQLAAEKAAEEKRLAEQKAAEEEARRLEEERVRAQREEVARAAAEAQRKAQEAERRAQEAEEARKAAEAARKKAEEEAAQRQREWEERLAKLEQQVSHPGRQPERTETARPEGSPHQGSRAGDRMTVRVGAREVALRWCPADTFTMGSPTGEEGRWTDETPHRVTLTRGFWMGETEVTQGLWREVTGENPSYFKSGDNYPVESVSWEDCQKFVQALNARHPQAGMRWALPTEAQWEYACRAGTGTALPNGKDIRILGDNNAPVLDDIAWYGGNSSVNYTGSNGYDTSGWPDKQYPGGKAGTHPVGGKEANAWGLHDMIGNVWEWCADWYGAYPNGAVTDPTGPSTGSHRVRRGGSWIRHACYCRSANRSKLGPGYRLNDNLGLRVALLPDQ